MGICWLDSFATAVGTKWQSEIWKCKYSVNTVISGQGIYFSTNLFAVVCSCEEWMVLYLCNVKLSSPYDECR